MTEAFAAAREGVPGSRAVLVEDSPRNLKSAKSLGLATVQMVAIAVLDALFLARGWYGVARLDPKWEAMTAPRHKGEYTK